MATSDIAELLVITTDPLLKGITEDQKGQSTMYVCQLLLQLHTGASPDHTALAPHILLSVLLRAYPVLQV